MDDRDFMEAAFPGYDPARGPLTFGPAPTLGSYDADPSKVQGKCPRGCGETLFLGSGGYVTCSYIRCPEPDAASNLLAHGQ